MAKWIIIILLLLPVAEIATFAFVAWLIGFGWASLLMLTTSVVGFLVLRRAGRSQLARFRVAVADSGLAGFEAHTAGFLTIVAGLLLLLPGFISDLAGAALLVRPVRRRVTAALRRAARRFEPGGGARREVVDLAPEEWEQIPDPKLPRRERGGDRDRDR